MHTQVFIHEKVAKTAAALSVEGSDVLQELGVRIGPFCIDGLTQNTERVNVANS